LFGENERKHIFCNILSLFNNTGKDELEEEEKEGAVEKTNANFGGGRA
jgi:hypothetical protein